MPSPVVVAEAPPTWLAAEVERPPLAPETGAAWGSWHAARAPDRSAVVVGACVTAPIPGWVDDMRPPFEARTVSLAAATASRLAGRPLETFDRPPALGLRPVASREATVGAARTFLGFDDSHVASCFVVCTAGDDAPGALSSCEAIVGRAKLEGGSGPPLPSLPLRMVTWGVHHPRPFALGFAAVVVFAGIFAVAFRRRPRARS